MATTLLLKQLICLYSDAYVRAKLCVNSMCMRLGIVKKVYGKEGEALYDSDKNISVRVL